MRVETFMRHNSLVTAERDKRGQFIRGDFKRYQIAVLCRQLQGVARDILDNIESYIQYEHRKGNLVDSTACAVYVDGELVEDTIQYATETPISSGPARIKHYRGGATAFNKMKDGTTMAIAEEGGMTGREAIEQWFDDHRTLPMTHNTVTLVAVAAMFYGYFLEAGTSGAHRKIKVISSIADALDREVKSFSHSSEYKPTLEQGLGHDFI